MVRNSVNERYWIGVTCANHFERVRCRNGLLDKDRALRPVTRSCAKVIAGRFHMFAQTSVSIFESRWGDVIEADRSLSTPQPTKRRPIEYEVE
jgi:hypothetical protein